MTSTRRSAAIALAAWLVAAAPGTAQQRDVQPQPANGTATLAGQVVTDTAPPRPVRKAIVTMAGDLTRTAITDEEGRFAFEKMPTGRYTVTAAKPAYVPAAYGATRPGRAGTPVAVARDQRVTITIPMIRGAVLTGMVRDRAGNPMPGVGIDALSTRASGRQGGAGGFPEINVTDDRGVYRIFGLAPGDYVIRAPSTSIFALGATGQMGSRSTADMDAVLATLRARAAAPAAAATPASIKYGAPVGLSNLYFPGTSSVDDAVVVTVGAGEERGGLDFEISPVATATIDGTITGPIQNFAVAQLSIAIMSERNLATGGFTPTLTLRPTGTDGHFRYTSVAPGRYRIVARADRNQTAAPPTTGGVTLPAGVGAPAPPGPPTADYLYAVAEVDARSQDVSGVDLALQPGATLSGRLRFDAATAAPPEKLDTIRVTLSPPGGTFYGVSNGTTVGNTFGAIAPGQVAADGTFLVKNVAPGTYALNVQLPADLAPTWSIQSAIVDTRDLLDAPVDIGSGTNLRDAVLTLSDRHTEISGTLQTPEGTAATRYFVVAFAADRTQRRAARRVVSTRPASDGHFALRDLPPGEYLLAAVTDLEPADLADATFLEQLVPASIRIPLATGEKKTQDVRMAR